MKTSHNLKRRDSGEGHSKILPKYTSQTGLPLKKNAFNLHPLQDQLQQQLHQEQSQQFPQLQGTNSQQTHQINPPHTFYLSHASLFFFTRTFPPVTVRGSRIRSPSSSNNIESRRRTKSVSLAEKKKKKFKTAVTLCSRDLESISDFQLRKKLKPLLDLDKVKKESF